MTDQPTQQPLPFYIVDAFTQTRYAGNLAGVVLPDSTLSDAQMLAIAGELHLESAFATPSTDLHSPASVPRSLGD